MSSMRDFTGKNHFWAFICLIMAAFIAVLFAMGRIPYCECGIGVWTWDAWSSATSQHFGDPYSLSHFLHGVIFFWALWVLRHKLSMQWRLLIAVVIEIAWEIFENTPFIIDRYRAATASLDYFGDSVLNSVGDVLFMIFGYWIAQRFRWYWSVALFIVIELAMLFTMRDNLTLNVVMLIYPISFIRNWQLLH